MDTNTDINDTNDPTVPALAHVAGLVVRWNADQTHRDVCGAAALQSALRTTEAIGRIHHHGAEAPTGLVSVLVESEGGLTEATAVDASGILAWARIDDETAAFVVGGTAGR